MLLIQVIGFTNVSDVGGVQYLAADSTCIWPYEIDREWPGEFGELTVAETIPQHIDLTITNDKEFDPANTRRAPRVGAALGRAFPVKIPDLIGPALSIKRYALLRAIRICGLAISHPFET